jgi:hypothetical protein
VGDGPAPAALVSGEIITPFPHQVAPGCLATRNAHLYSSLQFYGET